MTQSRAWRITYQGTPDMGRALASTLEEEGVAIAGIVVDGTTEAVNTAINVFRSRFPGAGGSVTIEGDDAGDD
jgi:hypothetical protein